MITNENRWETWVKIKQRQPKTYPSGMMLGEPYLMPYEIDLRKDDKHGTLDEMALVILLRPRSGGILAINLLDIPTNYRRRIVLELYMKALQSESDPDRVKRLLELERFVRASPLLQGAFKFYSRSRIQKAIHLLPEELEELVDKRII